MLPSRERMRVLKTIITIPEETSVTRDCLLYTSRPGDFEWQSRRNDTGTFEEMMNRFKQTSDEKMSDLKRGNESRRGYSRRGQQK